MSAGEFFDRQVATDEVEPPLLFRALRRWEVPRVDVAEELLHPGGRLLDVGCGDGELVCRVAARFDEIVATDVSEESLIRARARAAMVPGAEKIAFAVLDASRALPYPDGSFSAVVSLSTMQYLFDPEAFLREAARILAPGGRLLVEVPNVAFLPQRLRLLFGLPIRTSFWRHGIDGGNLHYYTVDTLTRLVREAGFTVEEVTGSGIFAPLRTWRVSLLCGNVFVKAVKRSAPGREAER